MIEPKENPDMKVLKTASCKSTSGKSTLTYQIGTLPDSTVHLRISKNTGAGFFNDEWIALKDIENALADGPQGQPLTTFLLQPLFRGRSSNSPGFMMAALMNERILRVLKGKKRGHEFLDPEGFTARMEKLVSAKSKPKVTTSTRKKAVVKKAPPKKAAIKKRETANRKASKTG
jgi:hypothetical protein